MGISRSGYYKWKKRGKSDRDIQRRELIALVDTVHAEHRSHGYRWTAAYIRQQYGYECSDNFVYKSFRYLGIKAETKHQVHYRKRKIKDTYPNLIFTTWDTVDRPRQVIVSDMTAFKFWIFYFEVTFYFDVFTKEILAYRCCLLFLTTAKMCNLFLYSLMFCAKLKIIRPCFVVY